MKYPVGTEFHTIYVSPPDEGAPMYGRVNHIDYEDRGKPRYNLTWVYSHDKTNFTTFYNDKDLDEILEGWTIAGNLTIKTPVCLPEELFTL
jgi:hypothetical protein